MQWCDFYEGFWDWADSTRRTRISSLENVGSGAEIVECVLEMADEKARAQLIRKAIKLGAVFSNDDFIALDGEVSAEVYEQLGKYAGFDYNDPCFDEENMTWDDFYGAYSDWDVALLRRRIQKLRQFGPSDEVAEVISCMPDAETEELLYQKAVAAGVKFSDEEMVAMGNLVEVLTKILENRTQQAEPASSHHENDTGRHTMGAPDQVVDIRLLDTAYHMFGVTVSYTKIYGNGTKKACRINAKDIGNSYRFFSPKPIVAAVCLGKVYCGFLRNDTRVLFVVWLKSGTAEQIQERHGSEACLKLLQLSEDTANGHAQSSSGSRAGSSPAQPYVLGKNELPQGSYLIGRDIPAGTYDFLVVYGTGGKFEMAQYNAHNKIVEGTWTFFWVGLEEPYEKRELIHVECKEGYTVKISGNVVLKIAKSRQVQIEL